MKGLARRVPVPMLSFNGGERGPRGEDSKRKPQRPRNHHTGIGAAGIDAPILP